MKRILSTLSQKWPEYLLEILVLIIGIYGAFALDEWNETRNKRLKENAILKEIHAEFLDNHAEFLGVKKTQERGYIAGEWILDHWPLTENISADSISLHLKSLFTVASFNSSDSNIEVLISNESFDIIQNDSLRRTLIKWQKVHRDYQFWERQGTDYFFDTFLPYFNPYIDLLDFRGTYQNIPNTVETKNIFTARWGTFRNVVNQSEIKELEEMIDTILKLSKSK